MVSVHPLFFCVNICVCAEPDCVPECVLIVDHVLISSRCPGSQRQVLLDSPVQLSQISADTSESLPLASAQSRCIATHMALNCVSARPQTWLLKTSRESG